MDRIDILKLLVKKYQYERFLEVGVRGGYCGYNDIDVPYKDGIEITPGGPANFVMSSDEFFEQNRGLKYDLIFIDGDHTYKQSYKDIINALPYITHNLNSSILMHDAFPPSKAYAKEDGGSSGEVWKTIVHLRCTTNLKIYTIDTDYGCAWIQFDKQELYTKDPLEICLDWDYMQMHKKELMHLITVKEFKNLL